MSSHPASLSASPPPARKRRRAPLSTSAKSRPLGPVAAALHARRQARSLRRSAREAKQLRDQGVALISEDGAVAFTLRPCGSDLFVERTQRRPLGTLTVQCLRFSDGEAFERWCKVEPTRFDYPILFDRLCRHGDDVLCR